MDQIWAPRTRRNFLSSLAAGGLALSTSPLWAEDRLPTASLTEGPFYPDKLPLDTDNDLLVINDATTPGLGEITHLTGRILTPQGDPVRNAFVEIWQVDNNGVYLHTGDTRIRDRRDVNFQGYGRFLTDVSGRYYFRTIKPVPYTGRCPHIHVAVSANGRRLYTTQLFIKDHPANERDFIFRALRDPAIRRTVEVEFNPLEGSKTGELAAEFDVIMGLTAQEVENGALKGGIGKPQWNRERG